MESKRGQPKQRKGFFRNEAVVNNPCSDHNTINEWADEPLTKYHKAGKRTSVGLLLGVVGVLVAGLVTVNTSNLNQYLKFKTPVQYEIKEVSVQEDLTLNGLIDWAADYNGAKIIYSQTSPSYYGLGGELIKLNSPELILSEDNSKGNCWAFNGNRGQVTIELASAIKPTSFTLKHFNTPDYFSAPKFFCVYNPEHNFNYGCYEFLLEHPFSFTQNFKCQENCSVSSSVFRVQVTSNQGSRNTCLYQVQVHGSKV